MNRHFHSRLGRTLAALAILLSAVGIQTFADETNCVAPPSGLVSWWAAEGNPNDSTGGNHATFYNGSYFAGKVGLGFAFNGSNSYASFSASSNLNVGVGPGFTIECWIKPEDLSKGQALVEWNDGAGNLGVHFWISIDALGGLGSLFVNLVDTAGHDHYFATAPNVLVLNALQHVALTYDKTTGVAVFYHNGSQSASQNLGTFTPQTPYGLFLGRRVSGPAGVGGCYEGVLDELSLYSRALSAEQIQMIFTAGSAGKCSGPLLPFIATQPLNQTVEVGDKAIFEVTAGGTPPLAYQWFFDSAAIDGATQSSLLLTNVQMAQAGNYSVLVTNAQGSILSSNAVLALKPPPSCVTPPVGLVGWWRGEGDTFDQVGGNNGTVVGNVSYGTGRCGQSYVFDGTGDLVSVGNRANLQLQDLSIEAWVKRNDSLVISHGSGNTGVIFGYGQGGYTLYVGGDGVLRFGKLGTSVVSDDATLSDTNFHHVAVTKSGTTVVFYVDGTAFPSTSFDAAFVFSTDAAIGARADNLDNSFLGRIDELSVYNRALSAAEVQAVYAAQGAGKCSGPTAPFLAVHPVDQIAILGESAVFGVLAGGTPLLSYQWSFNGTPIDGATASLFTLTNVQYAQAGAYAVLVTNAQGLILSSNAVLTVNPPPPCVSVTSNAVSWWRGEANAWDQLGSNHGTPAGDATFGSGKVGQAFVFDGRTDGVRIGNPAGLRLQDFTIEAWVKRASTTVVSYGAYGNALLFSYGQGGYGFYVDASGRLALSKIGITSVTSSARITDTSLHHVAVTKVGSTVKFYLDGTSYSVSSYNPGFVFTTDAAIGARGDTLDNSFYGTIDELALYNRALTADEIRAIHTAGASGKCAVAVTPYFLMHPASQTNTVGADVTFTASAGGTQPLAYQWRFNETVIAGATGTALTLTNVQFSQAGNYSVVVTNDGGTLTSSNAFLAVNHPPAGVRIVSANAASGGTVVVSVALAANGNENALGFSLNFNPAHLTFVEVTLGSGVPDGSLFFNSSQAAAGKLGVAVGLAPDAVFAAGTQEVALVRFTTAILSEATPTSIAFSDQPIQRLLSGVSGNVLPAYYESGMVTIAAVDYEGDVTPRPNGDRALTVSDWVVMGRYVARLDYPTNATEFQRADCAPRATLGDGSIKVTDWVQAGRYMAVLDPLTPLGGPLGEGSSAPRFAPPPQNGAPGRQLRGTDLTLAQGQVGTLAVALESQGDEAGVSFTLSFDPAALSFVGTAPGSGASGAWLYVNSSQAGQGKLGVALALPSGTFAAGTKEVVRINLRAAATATGSQALAFSDQLVPRDVSGVMANSLATTYVASNIVVYPPPALRIVAAEQQVSLAWAGWATNFTLQAATGALPVSGGWTNLDVTPVVTGGECTVILPRDTDAKFYRLRLP